MVFVRVDDSKTWRAEDAQTLCPEIVAITDDDSPYLVFDFSEIIPDGEAISSASNVVEVNSATITISATDVSDDGQKVSFKVAGMAAGDFTMRSTVTLSNGTTNVVSRDGLLRVS